MPDETAILEMGRRISYRDFAGDLAASVRFLESRDVRPGRLIGVEAGPRRYQQLLLFLACEVIGATATAFSQPDLLRDDPVLPDCDLLLLIGAQATAYRQGVVSVPLGLGAGVAARATEQDLLRLDHQPNPDSIVRISRTSGSTGRPKAVAYSRSIQQRILKQRFDYIPAGLRGGIRFLCLQSLSIRAIYTRGYMTLQAGGTVIFAHEEQAPALLQAGAANWIMLLVGEAEALVRRTERPPADALLLVELIGARTSRTLRRLVRERLGAIVHANYSSNETNTVCYTDDDDVGTLCSGAEVRIVDDHGNEQAAGKTGLIRVRTTTMASRYWNDPVLTAHAFVDGWYHTNDVGFVPEPGKLVVLGRADDMLNIGGIKLPPAPIEDEIRQISGVLDAAVLTISDMAGSDDLLVAVEVDATAPPADLRGRVEALVTRYVRSFHLLPLPSFPRTETGKVRRHDIAAAFRRPQQ